MGSIYRPTYTDRQGDKRTSAIWWIKYYSHGRAIRESTETADFGQAKDFLKREEGEAAKGRIPVSRRILFAELAQLVEDDYQINGYRSLVDIELRHRLHILPYFGKLKAVRIGEPDIDRYIIHRRDEGASNATVNRELSTIKRAFTLGIQKKLISDRPHISMLEEDNVRQGFFEREQYQAVRKHLPEYIQAVTDFAYITGWRKSEILGLQWKQVDFRAGTVRLEAGTTKNREARQFPFTQNLRAVLEAQRAKASALTREGKLCPYVFQHKGESISGFKRSWKTACLRAGLPGRIVHDFRRTAVRNLVRAGVPERVAMTMTGHKTRSVFERYNIVSEGDLLEAAKKLDSLLLKPEDRGNSTGKEY